MKNFILTLVLILSATSVMAASSTPDYIVKTAIKKYNAKNYTGCMQDLETYVKKKPTALAHYYLGMSYAQAGKKEEAIESYTKSIELAAKEKNNVLKSYATLGKKKMENPEAFLNQDEYDEVTGVLNRQNAIPRALIDDIKAKKLEYMRNEINAGREPRF